MNRIAELRKKSNLTQTELAGYLDIAQNTFSQYETGNRIPPINTIFALSAFFSVSPSYLMGRENDEENQILSLDVVSNMCLQRASDLLEGANADGVDAVKAIRELVEIALLIERRSKA